MALFYDQYTGMLHYFPLLMNRQDAKIYRILLDVWVGSLKGLKQLI